MAGSFEGVITVLGLSVGLACLQCGGRAVTDLPLPDGGEVSAAGTGGTANDEACDDAGASEAGCGGETGDGSITTYARLRTACNVTVNVNVNRRGQPVAICFHIR